MSTVELANLKPLHCQRDWFRRHVTKPLAQLHHREYRCPECDGVGTVGERDDWKCEVCQGWGTVYLDTLERISPEQVERMRVQALTTIEH